ncbi:hydroxyacylglutathione hydrolase [Klebsiella sp. BIGb0407]|uniref:hydroxyacylglutathione hydrolase n=1 Tax=Klebsiella sp. BIGb0407 TaxID=2940603 RepID=UPI00216A4DBD|nr:hydroxyacylglutathione hydrolase [Klebsiella sp. BIGb0407]MCS3432502.1 hydroxyacylglutathione hydrolase [Klebsiella sp. BIGb0407]
MKLTSISAFQDNYIWVLSDEEDKCVIVDPGEAAPVLSAIAQHQWQPVAILLTHHHRDHVGGVQQLKESYPELAIYGPAEIKIPGLTQIVKDGDNLQLLGHDFSVMATPGHTLGHVSYFSFPWLFCGDTLFSAGCGRLFEGTPDQMYESFQRINQLPPETIICCAHEYTESNVTFALSLLPEDEHINRFYKEVKALRAENKPTLPSTLAKERLVNVFLRTEDPDLQRKAKKDILFQQPNKIFAWLRAKKDTF